MNGIKKIGAKHGPISYWHRKGGYVEVKAVRRRRIWPTPRKAAPHTQAPFILPARHTTPTETTSSAKPRTASGPAILQDSSAARATKARNELLTERTVGIPIARVSEGGPRTDPCTIPHTPERVSKSADRGSRTVGKAQEAPWLRGTRYPWPRNP